MRANQPEHLIMVESGKGKRLNATWGLCQWHVDEAPSFQGTVSRKVEQKTSLDFYITTTMEMPSFSSMSLSLYRDITYIFFRPQVEDRGGVWSFSSFRRITTTTSLYVRTPTHKTR